MAKRLEVVTISGEPHLLLEKNTGVFVVVDKIITNKEGDYTFRNDSSLEELTLGQQITEINLHGQKVLVKQPVGFDQIEYIVQDVKAFARNMGYKYFGLEILGGKYIGELITTKGGINYWEVCPRLFVDND